MRASSQKDLSVYDFDEQEESVEVISGKIKSRFDPKPPKTDEIIDKYRFLQAFTPMLNLDQKDVTDLSCIDLCEGDNARVSYALDTTEENLSLIEEKSESDEVIASSSSSHEHGQVCQDEFEPGTFTGVDCLEPPSDGSSVDVISDDEGNWELNSRSPSTSASDHSEDGGLFERQGSYFPEFEDTYDNEIAVTVFPDHILYGEMLYGESRLTFFSDCIKIECSYSDASGDDKKFVVERTVADIIHIDRQWIQCAEIAIIRIGLRATGFAGTMEVNDDHDSVKLSFSVTGIHWLEKEQKILALAPRYKDIWNAHSSEVLELEDDFVESNMFIPKHYFTEIVEPYEDVIYPKGDPDAVSISKRDIELLQPDTFINDTIIDFYIKYLKNKIQPGERHRFHFFNSFFFRKLADLDKDPGSALEGRAAFQRVRKWTRKVNIFDKDYVFIPVNYNLHWSLLVICHPGEIATIKDVDVEEYPKVPCILHMDSIKGSHSGLRTLIQSYLSEEWKERNPELYEENSSKFSDLRFVALELPQQENSFDCGLFLLHYVELFLEKAPARFSPFKVTKFSRFLTADWFLPAEASLKRSHIRRLIYDLLLKDPSHPSSLGYPGKDIGQEPSGDFVSDSRIEIKLLITPPPTVAQCDSQGPILHEFLAPRAAAESSDECRENPVQHNAPSQKLNCIEECADTAEQSVSSIPDKEDHFPPGEQICSTSYFPKDVETYEIPWNSSQGQEELSVDFLLNSSNSNHMTSNLKEDTGNPQSLAEKCGYVPDCPTASFGEKLIDTRKEDDGHCEVPQRGDTTEDSGNDKESQITDSTAKDEDVGRGGACQETNRGNVAGVEEPTLENRPDTEAESSDDENSGDKDDVVIVKGEPGEGLGQQPLKRRKRNVAEECTRRTRSCRRSSP